MNKYQYPLTNEAINEFLNEPIHHPRFKEGLKFISRAFNSYGRAPYSCYILGESGTGKSKLADIAYQKALNTAKPDEEANIIPAVFVTLDQGALPDEVRKLILDELNVDYDGYAGKKLKDLLRKQLEICKVKTIMFDEFHHLLRRNDTDVNRNAANFIKTIVDMDIPIVLFGTPEGEKIFKIHNELHTRVLKALELPLMSIDNAKHKQYFAVFLQKRMENFPLKTVDLSTDENLLRVFLATGGVLRHLNLLLSEVLAEYRDGKKSLELKDYQAVDNFTRKDVIRNARGGVIKPFTSDISVIKNKLKALHFIPKV